MVQVARGSSERVPVDPAELRPPGGGARPAVVTSPGVRIERLDGLPADRLAPLIAESEAAGLRFVRPLADESAGGVHRFGRPRQALLAARRGRRLVAGSALN